MKSEKGGSKDGDKVKELEAALEEKNESHVKTLEILKQTITILRDKLQNTFDEIETKNKEIDSMHKNEKDIKQILNQIIQNFTEKENPDFEIKEGLDIISDHLGWTHDDILKLREEADHQKPQFEQMAV